MRSEVKKEPNFGTSTAFLVPSRCRPPGLFVPSLVETRAGPRLVQSLPSTDRFGKDTKRVPTLVKVPLNPAS